MTKLLVDRLMELADAYSSHRYVDGAQGSGPDIKDQRSILAREALLAALQELTAPQPAQPEPSLTYSSTQATKCACCGVHKHTPLRVDFMGGYVCLTCIDMRLEVLDDTATMYAKQVAHWIGKHDALLEQQLAQPEQRTAGCTLCGHCAATGEKIQAAQPVAQPLTDEQIDDLWVEHGADDRCEAIGFARAIEQAHGIGAKE